MQTLTEPVVATVTVHCQCPGYCPLFAELERDHYRAIKDRGFAVIVNGCTNPRGHGDVLVVQNHHYRLYWTSEK